MNKVYYKCPLNYRLETVIYIVIVRISNYSMLRSELRLSMMIFIDFLSKIDSLCHI